MSRRTIVSEAADQPGQGKRRPGSDKRCTNAELVIQKKIVGRILPLPFSGR
jgi:hypothetical protein